MFLLDMDGTIYLGDKLFDCTPAFLATLGKIGARHLFLTNNSSKDRDSYVAKLAKLGIEATPDDVFTSGEATTIFMRSHFPGRRLAVFGMPTLVEEFRRAGFEIDDANPECVVLGFDQAFTYATMTRLCDLVRSGLPYIATHPDFNCPVVGGFIPDIGASIAYVKASTGREPDYVIGKPNAGIIDSVAAKYGFAKSELAMVGDRLYTDIAVGANAGITSILVFSGETTEADYAASTIRADYTFKDVGELANALAFREP